MGARGRANTRFAPTLDFRSHPSEIRYKSEVEVAEGLLVYQGGADPETIAWWKGLSGEERQQAEAAARRYEALSEEERDASWNEGAESLETDAEGDEIARPARERSA